MAHSIELWERAEALFLAGVPVVAIEAETGIKKSAIYKRTGNWERKKPVERRKVDILKEMERRGDVEQLSQTEDGKRILEEVEARAKLKEIESWKATAPKAQVDVHDELVLDRLTLERAFATSAMRNQAMTDQVLSDLGDADLGYAGIDILKKHAETTKLNKALVLGGDPVVMVNGEAGDEKSLVMMPDGMSEGLPSLDDAVLVDTDD